MKVHCPEHGEIKRSDTVHGYEWSKGRYVVLDESDFEAVPLSTLCWPDEVRDAADLDISAEDADFKPAEIEVAPGRGDPER